ncbi:alpha/beta hydrolase [uncultured Thermanaerothrix sp.]|uniref:alpha/beta hydrolase n=1 Tax=uncultured Thermanaerothrix sp. TaxID=1195149 RepID=UPI002623AAA0|nr:alpha/beta hydrolase [uncultured Thermanaerothrix sp.]
MPIREHVLTIPQGYRLFAREWAPESPPHALILLVHGLGEHSGRYHHVAQAFNRHGWLVLAPDLPGHGRSEGKRGHIRTYDEFLDIFDWLRQDLQQRFPGIPQILFGHSMGGNLVLYYALQRTPPLRGVIACSPGLRAAKPSPIPLWLGKLLRGLFPALLINNGLDLNGLSRDPQVIQTYVDDPLVHPHISLSLGLGLLEAGQWLLEWEGEFPYPLLLMQGTADRLVDPVATSQFASRLHGPVVYKAWEGFYHELHNEPEKDAVIAYMLDWIRAIVEDQQQTPS